MCTPGEDVPIVSRATLERVKRYLDEALQTTDLIGEIVDLGGIVRCREKTKYRRKKKLLCRDAESRSVRSGLETIGRRDRMGPEADDRIISPRLLPTDRAENPKKNRGIDEYRSVGLEIK